MSWGLELAVVAAVAYGSCTFLFWHRPAKRTRRAPIQWTEARAALRYLALLRLDARKGIGTGRWFEHSVKIPLASSRRTLDWIEWHQMRRHYAGQKAACRNFRNSLRKQIRGRTAEQVNYEAITCTNIGFKS